MVDDWHGGRAVDAATGLVLFRVRDDRLIDPGGTLRYRIRPGGRVMNASTGALAFHALDDGRIEDLASGALVMHLQR